MTASRSSLESRLADSFAAHVTDGLATDDTWAAILIDAEGRGDALVPDPAPPAPRSRTRVVAVAALAAAALLVAAVVVRLAPDTVGGGDDGQPVSVGTAPAADSPAANQAITDVARATIDLASALEAEQLAVAVQEHAPTTDTEPDAVLSARTRTDAAVAAWRATVDGSGLTGGARERDATKQATNRLDHLDDTRALAPSTDPRVGSMTSEDAYASTIADVLTVLRSVSQGSTSVAQTRALLAVVAAASAAAQRSTVAAGVLRLRAAGAPADPERWRRLALSAEDARQDDDTLAELATPAQWSAWGLDGPRQSSLRFGPLADAGQRGVPLPFDARAWVDAAVRERDAYAAAVASALDTIPRSPAADRADVDPVVRAAFVADLDLEQALQAEARAHLGIAPRLLPAPDPTEAATDAAIERWRDAMDATSRLDDPDLRDAVAGTDLELRRRLDLRARAHAGTAGLYELVDATQQRPSADAQHDVRLLLAWHAGSVPALRQLLVVHHLAASVRMTGATTAIGLVRLSGGADSPAGLSMATALGRAQRAESDADELATGETKQAVRAATAAVGPQLDTWLREVDAGLTTTTVTDLAAAAFSWEAARWRVIRDLATERIDPDPPPPPPAGTSSGAYGTVVAGAEATTTTTTAAPAG